jgi:hypothetical protein
MFTLREIFYNEKLRGCFATAIPGRTNGKTGSATLNPAKRAQMVRRSLVTSDKLLRFSRGVVASARRVAL